MAILTELRDPRIQDVTVTFVEVSGDLRHAQVHVSVMGDEAKQKLTLYGLENASGFLQPRINDRIETRYTPKLKFVLDQGVKQSLEVARILDEVLPKPPPSAPSDASPPSEDDDSADDGWRNAIGGLSAGRPHFTLAVRPQMVMRSPPRRPSISVLLHGFQTPIVFAKWHDTIQLLYRCRFMPEPQTMADSMEFTQGEQPCMPITFHAINERP